jgi:hypothetical protein
MLDEKERSAIFVTGMFTAEENESGLLLTLAVINANRDGSSGQQIWKLTQTQYDALASDGSGGFISPLQHAPFCSV